MLRETQCPRGIQRGLRYSSRSRKTQHSESIAIVLKAIGDSCKAFQSFSLARDCFAIAANKFEQINSKTEWAGCLFEGRCHIQPINVCLGHWIDFTLSNDVQSLASR